MAKDGEIIHIICKHCGCQHVYLHNGEGGRLRKYCSTECRKNHWKFLNRRKNGAAPASEDRAVAALKR